MIKIVLILVFSVLFLSSSCTEVSPLISDEDFVVVWAFLYQGEHVDDIKLTSTLPLGSQDSIAPPINDAEAYLLKNGQRYDLQPSAGDSGYYHYNGDDLFVKTGDIFEINVVYYDKVVSGKTVVPPAPDSLTISSDSLYILESFFPPNEADTSRYSLLVTWAYEPSSLFYVTIENIEPDPEPIELDGPGDLMGPNPFISAPMGINEYQIMFFNVTHYGKHRIRVYHVNQEYADIYLSRLQDSRDLNEPLTNIENGLGVFSAFNSDYAYFWAVSD